LRKEWSIHPAWVILVVCFLDLYVNYSVRLGYGVVLPEMIRDLDFGRTAAGSIYNAYLLVYIVVTPVSGYLTDRFGARRVITTCVAVLGIGVLMMGRVQSLATACLFFALAGLGATGLWAPVITLVQRWFADNRRGMALGILSTGYGLGFASMGAVFPRVVQYFNWRYAWYILGAMAMCLTVVNGLFLRSDPEQRGLKPWGERLSRVTGRSASKPLRSPLSLRGLFKQPNFLLIGVSYAAVAFSLYSITTFMVDYAASQLALPFEKASYLATIHGLCQVVGVLIVLPASDYLGRKRTILISNAIITLSTIGILASGTSWEMLCAMIAVLALFYGATFPIYGACAGDYFPRRAMGTVIGAWTPFYGCGAILAHWVTGAIRDVSGSYNAAFILCAVTATLSLVMISFVRKRPMAAADRVCLR